MATRLERLSARRMDPSVPTAKQLNEVYRRIHQSDSVRYTLGAMQPIDPDYTANTFAEGERICDQLRRRLSGQCDYEYQGSVTNDTHIKARSDIDVLVLTGKFVMLEKPQVPSKPYIGNPLQDLIDLRADVLKGLSSAYPEADVDASGAKSIALSGGSLRRKVDVVPANWFNTNQYAQDGNKIWRGVQILDSKKREAIKNTPFLHNAWIEHKDAQTKGGLRKAARLMKSLKYDSDAITLSSYDIVSIAFNIPESKLSVQNGMDMLLLDSCYEFCSALQRDQALRQGLEVPDKHRRVFAEGHATLAGLNELTDALAALVKDVLVENQRSFRRLAEARIDY